MESRVGQAVARHARGYNCAQAVACTYADLVGMDEQTMFRLTEALGLGGGNMEGTCGALSGAQIILSLLASGGDLERPTSKGATYARARVLDERFRELTGAYVCGDIKGVRTGKVLCPCPMCVAHGAQALEECAFSSTDGLGGKDGSAAQA